MKISTWVKKWILQGILIGILLRFVSRSFLVHIWGACSWWLPLGYFSWRGSKIAKIFDRKGLMEYFVKQEVLKWLLGLIGLGSAALKFGWGSGGWLIGYIIAIAISLLMPINKYD